MAENKKTITEYYRELPGMIQQLDAFRAGSNNRPCVDISLAELVQETYGLSMDAYYKELGVNPNMDTMSNIYSMPDTSIRWLVPEVIREAIYLGIKEAPFYPNLIAADQTVSNLKITMPYVNMSEATPARINEAETIPLGNVSFGQKSVSLYKIGKGFKITDEVRNYVALNVLSIYLRDFGVQLGYALDTLAIDVAINGNMADGNESAPVIGVDSTADGIQYKDLLRLWIRASRLGRNFTTMIGSEDESLHILDLEEFKLRQQGTTQATLNLHTPVPNTANFYIHPGIPEDQVMLIDPRAAMIKLTARQLMMESERIVSNQTEAVYATLTTGFAKMYKDAVLMLDSSETFASAGFPDFMNIDPLIQSVLD